MTSAWPDLAILVLGRREGGDDSTGEKWWSPADVAEHLLLCEIPCASTICYRLVPISALKRLSSWLQW
jgi:hypothetical protein